MNETATLLHNFGFPAKLAKSLAGIAHENGLTLANVQSWVEEARSSRSLNNPLGFIRARLQDGDILPSRSPTDQHIVRRAYYERQFDGILPRHPNHQAVLTKTGACGHVAWKDRICLDCGLCPRCCTCQSPDPNKE